MGKPSGFREFDRQTPGQEPVDKRIQGYYEFWLPLSREELEKQAARCMDCGTPFCHPNCPLHNIPPDFNDHVFRGKWEGAFKSLSSTNNFPEFTGRVCPAPCESGCVLGLIKEPVSIKNIEVSIVENAYETGIIKPRPPKNRTDKQVAVAGSGPAGLAVADQLNKAGHNVTVFERDNRIGGLLRYGIPDFKLEKSVVERRVNLMRDEGIEFKTNANVGVNISADDLKKDFDAVVLAGGSTIPRDLPIPGRELDGVHYAMDFLTQNNRRVEGQDISSEKQLLATDKHVLVIGGGDTGSDCVGTSIRQGAASVTQIELLPKPPEKRPEDTPWPIHPGPRVLAISTSHQEGCDRLWAVSTNEFIGEDGRVTKAKYVDVNWLDVSKFKFEAIIGSEKEFKADLILLAMGFLNPDPVILDAFGVDKDNRNNAKTDNQYQTSVSGVFAAGDMRRGQSLVVWAIAEGRECAREVDKFLRSGITRLESKNKTFSTLS